ncbi:MarR family transcriptional regulator [Paeniglutamicibacter antarcticus]|uniref:MarR family transcriptional regulator n=1 Tax=Arthrobacter terrae TaxID=2935737 RepID=A0A931CSP5_9MICC|nr:MarR family transcriptional regulator [Arthrobacter terrae]MBG0740191.1 MarR family transcriptional regulator [Arthrobacter terrae]
MTDTGQGAQARTRGPEASRLMRRILVLNHEVEKQLGRELTVNSTDLDVMQHLMQSGPLSPSTLAQLLGISTAAVTVAIDRLVKRGHVSRQPHPTDRRRLLVVPAPDSTRRAMANLLPMIREVDALITAYTQDEQSAITDYLAKTVDILERKVAPSASTAENR